MDFLRRLGALFGRRHEAVAMSAAPADDADEIVRQICAEALAARSESYDPPDIGKSVRWAALFPGSRERLTSVAFAALRSQRSYSDFNERYNDYRNHNEPRSLIFGSIFLANLHFEAHHLLEVLQGWDGRHLASEHYSSKILLRAIEQLVAQDAVKGEVKSALRAVSDDLCRRVASGEDAVQVMVRIERILNPPVPDQTELPPGPFTSKLRGWVDTLDPGEREPWRRFFLVCTEAKQNAKPSGRWLRKAKQAIDEIGTGEASKRLCEMLDTVDLTYSHDRDRILIGLVRAMTMMAHSAVAGPLGLLAERWYMTKTGNAALWALSEMPGEPRAAAELFRLRERIKQPATRILIDRRLSELAQKAGTTIAALEDFSLPDYGLDQNSRLFRKFGEACVTLDVTPTAITQAWTSAVGKSVKSVPAGVRDAFGEELASYRRQAKDIDAARNAQVKRLEQSWAEERNWRFSDWTKHFLCHPLRRPIVASLIWQIGDKAVIPDGEVVKDVSGNALNFSPGERVALWHPVLSAPQDVLAWRARIVQLGLVQPIKQAHREIYVLTDAERVTRTYSNRFAAHILRQHQFTRICQTRDWRYKLQGDWDGWNLPTRSLPAQNISVEFRVETMDGGDKAGSGIYLHITSDRVRFLDAHRQPIALDSIAPTLLSEVMRDVDLFVAVTSVANDPTWTDGGPDGRFGGYWQEWAFGELGQTAVTRRELASWIAPKLSIAGKLEITDKFLMVQGKRQKYAIHFGSSNIQILPSNRYLCIVPAGAPKEARDIKLPFDGDSMFSTILSKAFLLADEDKIKDETILRQL